MLAGVMDSFDMTSMKVDPITQTEVANANNGSMYNMMTGTSLKTEASTLIDYYPPMHSGEKAGDFTTLMLPVSNSTTSNSAESDDRDSQSSKCSLTANISIKKERAVRPSRKKCCSILSKKAESQEPGYWEKRRKNNESAKRSRDSKREKEEEIIMKVCVFQEENRLLIHDYFMERQNVNELRAYLGIRLLGPPMKLGEKHWNMSDL